MQAPRVRIKSDKRWYRAWLWYFCVYGILFFLVGFVGHYVFPILFPWNIFAGLGFLLYGAYKCYLVTSRACCPGCSGRLQQHEGEPGDDRVLLHCPTCNVLWDTGLNDSQQI
ncbi:MAG: hypothetical protein R3C18_08830 [Planctomycetaceae bacterium]